MPHEIQYDPANACMMCRLTGNIDQDLVMEFASALAPLMEEHGCTRVLNDFRGADLSVSYFDIYKIPKLPSVLKMTRLTRRALLLDELPEEIASYEDMSVNQGQFVKAFTDLDQAISWLTGDIFDV